MMDANRLSIQVFEEAVPMITAIRPLIADHDPMVVSFVLADLTSTWIAGHLMTDPKTGEVNRKVTDETREAVLQQYLHFVRQLIPINHDMIMHRHLQP